MTTHTILWTVLPDGVDPSGDLKLSLVASPQIGNGAATLTGHPLADWPSLVRDLGPLRVEVVGLDGATTVVDAAPAAGSPVPDSALWRALLPGTTVVRNVGGGLRGVKIDAQASYVAAADGIDRTLSELVAREVGGMEKAGESVLDALAALHGGADSARRRTDADGAPRRPDARTPDLADVDHRSGSAVTQAVRALQDAGRPGMGAAVAIASYAQALRGPGDEAADPPKGRRTRSGALVPAARPTGAGVGTIGNIGAADFHQLIGLLLGHPELAKRVGLRLDLTMPAFTGVRDIRVVDAQGRPLDGPVPRPQPYSRVDADPARRRFVMVAGPGSETADGVLDLRKATPGGRHLVTTRDVASLAQQLDALAVARSQAVSSPVADQLPDYVATNTAELPLRRDVGITVARERRPEAVIEASVRRTIALEAADQVVTRNGAPVLFADDVRRGYRFDVSTDGSRFRSLMQRRVEYRVGGSVQPTVTVTDEGTVDAMTAAAPGTRGAAVAGEEIVTWAGWALAAPRPGRAVAAFPGQPEAALEISPGSLPGVALTSKVSAVQGTVPTLRFGHRYALAARAVDLAGNSLPAGASDPARATEPVPYLRQQAAEAPALVPLARYTDGESLQRLVVRTRPDGTVLGGSCQRHLVPPPAAHQLSETHGTFDAAFGPAATPAQRAAALTTARRESGSLLDPVVVAPDGTAGPARGIALVTNDPSAPRVSLPLPRGTAVPNGYYVVHDTPSLVLPYPPDPIVSGVAITGIPGRTQPLVVPYTGGRWPDTAPSRVMVVPAPTAKTPFSAKVTVEGGRNVLVLTVPPAFAADLTLSSTIRPDLLPQLDAGDAPADVVVAGQHPLLSARTTLTVVHAVPTPLAKPAILDISAKPAPNPTNLLIDATVTVHRPSTGRVDLGAAWTERIDDGTGPIRTVTGQAQLGGDTPKPGSGPVTLALTHHVGDARARTVQVHATAGTAFREYFTTASSGSFPQPAVGPPVPLQIPNRTVPPAPVIHSVVPLFRWTRKPGATEQQRVRSTTGVRVWLKRPWLVTGEGEQLGVVIAPTDGKDQVVALPATSPAADYLTRVGADPIEEGTTPGAVLHLQFLHNFPLLAGQQQRRHALQLVDAAAAGTPVQVIGFDVQFDADRDMWFADVEMSVPGMSWPFVRFAFVRLQPNSAGPGCQLSTVERSDFVQLPPARIVRFSKVGKAGVRATVVSTVAPRKDTVTFTLRQERMLTTSAGTSPDLGSSDGVDEAAGWTVTQEAPVSGEIARVLLDHPNPASVGSDVLEQLLAGRVVIEEVQQGISIDGTPGRRTVFTETIPRAAVGLDLN